MGLMRKLNAFSTAISWTCHSDRTVTYLSGVEKVSYYRVINVFGFCTASFADTTIYGPFGNYNCLYDRR